MNRQTRSLLLCAIHKFNKSICRVPARTWTYRRRDCVIRSAKESDIAAICELSRLAHKENYHFDYLPAWLPAVLKEDSREAVVAEKDGKIVAFIMGVLGVDGGRSFSGESGRTHPEYEGQGLLGHAISCLMGLAIKRYPQCERMYGCSPFTNFYDQHPEKIEILSRRSYTRCLIPVGTPAADWSVPESLSPAPPRKVSPDELGQLLSDPNTCRLLFPQGTMVTAQEVYMPIASNVPYATLFHPDIFVGEDHRSVSMGGRFVCNDGLAWRHNFNYSGKVDLFTCLTHLAEHFRLYDSEERGEKDKDLYLFVNIPNSFQNLFGKDALVYEFQDRLGIDIKNITVYSQYNFEYV